TAITSPASRSASTAARSWRNEGMTNDEGSPNDESRTAADRFVIRISSFGIPSSFRHSSFVIALATHQGETKIQTSDLFNPFDPAGLFKSVRDSGMDAWSKAMIQFVNSECYAQAIGAMLDAWLTTSAPFRKAVESAMTQALVNLNMPTRDDVTRLAERLTHI